jgi:hypothetical protein
MATITNLVPNPRAFSSPSGGTTSSGTNSGVTRITTLTAPLPGNLAGVVTTAFRATVDVSSGDGGDYSIQAANIVHTAFSHVASCYLYIPNTWSGDTISLRLSGLSGVSGETNANMALTNQWQRLSFIYTPGVADLTGNFQIRVDANVVLNQTFDATCFMIHQGDSVVSYFDGGYVDASYPVGSSSSWSGTAHASSSTLITPEVVNNSGGPGDVTEKQERARRLSILQGVGVI